MKIMKSIGRSNGKRAPAPGGWSRARANAAKFKKAYSKVARQEVFIESVAKLPVDEAVSRAKLIANVNPSDFRIVRMPG